MPPGPAANGSAIMFQPVPLPTHVPGSSASGPSAGSPGSARLNRRGGASRAEVFRVAVMVAPAGLGERGS